MKRTPATPNRTPSLEARENRAKAETLRIDSIRHLLHSVRQRKNAEEILRRNNIVDAIIRGREQP